MIDLYYWPTPNGWKVSIMLEECGLAYKLVPVDITRGAQFEPDFLKFSPNNRMPAIVDHQAGDGAGSGPLAIFESGAILVYLAEKTGRFMAADNRAKYDVLQWLFWQMGGLGPMAGQTHHFRQYAPEPIPYAVDRYTNEVNRLYGVMNNRLSDREFLAGDYSIADMASWPWVVPHERQGQTLDDFPHLKRWFETLEARPAVQKGRYLGEELRRNLADMGEEERRVLFGQTAETVAKSD